jgi:DNA mismatch repair protein MutS
VAVREWNDEVVFLHKILPGGTDKSYGVHVAKLAGLPPVIVSRSREILTDLENTFSKEVQDEQLSKNKTVSDEGLLFVQRNKSVLDRVKSIDVNNLTPLEAINLLNEIKKEIE